MEGHAMLRLIMLPSNAICDALGMTDEHERGMVRMLVNTLLWTTLCVTAALVALLLLE
jgi:hypothetical protein